MKRNIFLFATVSLIAGGLIFQNCGGTLTRTATLDLSRAEIDAQLNALDSSSQTDVQSFFSILDTQGSSLYYAEAPSSMGDIDTVMPLSFDVLGLQKPAKAYAYFAFILSSDGPHGSLLITDGAQVLLVLTSNSSAGSINDEDGLNLVTSDSNGRTISFYSGDVVDGDLAEVIQFELSDSQGYSLGLINMAQP